MSHDVVMELFRTATRAVYVFFDSSNTNEEDIRQTTTSRVLAVSFQEQKTPFSLSICRVRESTDLLQKSPSSVHFVDFVIFFRLTDK